MQGTGLAVLAAVFQDQGNACFIIADLLQFAGFHGLAQTAQLNAGLGQVHVNGVQLADGGQGVGLVGGDQGAGGDGGAPDAAADRCLNGGVVQVDLRAFQVGAGGGHRGLVLVQGSFGFVIFLLAHGAAFQQGLEAIHAQGVGVQGGLGPGQLRPCRVHGSLVGPGVDLVERLPGFHLLAFFEQALFDHAAYLRAHFGNLVSGGAPGQLPAEGGGLSLYRNEANLRRLLLLLLSGLVAVTATAKLQGKGACQEGENQTAAHNHL